MSRRAEATAIATRRPALPAPLAARHGWARIPGSNIALAGPIVSARLGTPDGVRGADAAGEVRTVEAGPPWRNDSARLRDGDLARGMELGVIGKAPAATGEGRMKAEPDFGDVTVLLGGSSQTRLGTSMPSGRRHIVTAVIRSMRMA